MDEQQKIDLDAAVADVIGLITAARHLPASELVRQALEVNGPHDGEELRVTLLRVAETSAITASIANALLEALVDAAEVPESAGDDILRRIALRYAQKQVGE